jgi:predicted NACHT family NTPase
VYVPLHQHAQSELGSFETTFLKAPEFITLWQRKKNPPQATSPRFRLYLDGLDEVPSLKRQKGLLELAMKGKEADPRISIIVTGRDHVMGVHLRRFARVRVREFDDDQIKELAARWFERDDHSIEEFFNQLNKVPTLVPLMRVPLLATLVFGVYRNTKTLPESRAKLYDMFVSLLAGGWDVAKNVHRQTEFGPAPKLIVLTKLAAMLHMGQRRDCRQADFHTAVKTTLPALRAKSQKLLEETIQDGLLIQTGITFAFAHLSFQEYLSAKSLFEPNSGKAAQVFRAFLEGDDWWREVVTFYIALSTDPKDVEHFVHRMAEKVRSKTARDFVRSRAGFLLETLAMCFPGAEPNFKL